MNWIEKKLYEERRARRLSAWCVVIFFALLAAWAVWARRDAPGRLRLGARRSRPSAERTAGRTRLLPMNRRNTWANVR